VLSIFIFIWLNKDKKPLNYHFFAFVVCHADIVRLADFIDGFFVESF
jgi:hypothetical protein